MRLKCPNCGAEYEIDAAMIPEAGRDVQCAACGHGWFQEREAGDKSGAILLDTLKPPHPAAPPEVSKPPTPPAAEPKAPVPDTGAFLTPDRRSLDPAVRKVLEEEAARERRARAAEAGDGGSIETQGDLGLDAASPEAKPKVADGVFGGASAGLAKAKAPRAASLPDIDEINSSLRATSERDPRTEAAALSPQDRSRKRGFRLGFGLVMIVLAAALLSYGNAPRLADQFPEMRDPLARYVDRVNGLRDGIDSALGNGADRMDRLQ